MPSLPCSVSADLRAYESAQDRAEKLHDAHGNRVLEGIADDIMEGGKRNGYTIHDFLDCVDPGLMAAFFKSHGDAKKEASNALDRQMKNYLISFFDEHEPEYVSEMERSADEDARADAMEAKAFL